MFRLGNTLLNLPGRRGREGFEWGWDTEDNLPPQSPSGNLPPQSPPGKCATPKAPPSNLPPQRPPIAKGTLGSPRRCPYRPVELGKKRRRRAPGAPKSPFRHAPSLHYKAPQISRSFFQQLHHHGPGEANEALGGAERGQQGAGYGPGTAKRRGRRRNTAGSCNPCSALAPPAPLLSKSQPRAGPGLRKC